MSLRRCAPSLPRSPSRRRRADPLLLPLPLLPPTGLRLCTAPAALLAQLTPLTRFIEDKAALKPHGAGDEASLALSGLALAALGYTYLMSVYTLDRKAQMNGSASHTSSLASLHS